MQPEQRKDAARYYDLAPDPLDDVPFYRDLIPSAEARILELGCGTGRVMVPLARAVGRIFGVDHSREMLEICERRLTSAGLASPRAAVSQGDITSVRLGERFDLVIAPYRVLQNLESDDQVAGLLATIRAHLDSGGFAVLNVFNPYRDRAGLIRDWCAEGESLEWEVDTSGGRVACFVRKPRLDPERMVLYPEIVYRSYDQGDELTDEVVLPLVMRCYYADELNSLITGAGFEVMNRWGGYHGEPWDEGPELVLQFRDASPDPGS